MRSLSVLLLVVLAVTTSSADEPKPLWLSAKGKQPPRLYLFWQYGWTPKRNPKHIDLVRKNPPDPGRLVLVNGVNE